MQYQAHRGVGTEFPENTMPAFEAAAAQGYAYIELDPAFTKDDRCVVLHDRTINRTCRYPDGGVIRREIPLSDLSYEQALAFDAGLFKAYKFRGTRIPLLSEVLEWAKGTDLTVKLDNTIQRFPDHQIALLFDIVERAGAKVAFTGSELPYVQKVLSRFPGAEIHYDGPVDEATLIDLRAMVQAGRLYVWLPLACPATAWVKVATAQESLCRLVKRYAKLGLWIVSGREQVETAERYRADLIETAGEIKPRSLGTGPVDCHTHTRFSHDGACDPQDSLLAAKEKGLAGFAITDHCDMEDYGRRDLETPLQRSVACARRMGDFVLSGVEIGEAIWHRETAGRILEGQDWDIVLGSVHAVRYKDYTAPYSTLDFSAFSGAEIDGYLKTYFQEVREMVETTDLDVLAHLTCPWRYLCGKYGIAVEESRYQVQIEGILREIIRRGIALEVNTSCLDTRFNHLLPHAAILRQYKDLGGYLITVGSDAHRCDRIAYGFETALRELSRLGFQYVFSYKKRRPICWEIRL